MSDNLKLERIAPFFQIEIEERKVQLSANCKSQYRKYKIMQITKWLNGMPNVIKIQ